MDKLLQGLTAGIAIAALIVSFWQAYRSRLVARQATAGPVLASVYNQFRDSGFRQAVACLHTASTSDLDSDFASLQGALQDSAYTVCYFFEYIGLLVAFRHLDQEIVLDSMSTQLIDIWRIMRPAIAQERKTRSQVPDPYYGKRFLPHYEHLIALITLRVGARTDQVARRNGLYSLLPSHALYPETPVGQPEHQRSLPPAGWEGGEGVSQGR